MLEVLRSQGIWRSDLPSNGSRKHLSIQTASQSLALAEIGVLCFACSFKQQTKHQIGQRLAMKRKVARNKESEGIVLLVSSAMHVPMLRLRQGHQTLILALTSLAST